MLRSFLQRQAAAGRSYARALYVGDGRGDYCPSVLLLHGSGSGGGTPAATATPTAEAAAAAAAVAAAAAETAEAADKPATTAASGGGSGAHAPAPPAPCGGGSNVVFVREEYPDGSPCSLWVMLRTEGGSSARDASGGNGRDGAALQRRRRGVVGWARPEQLAALLRQEVGLPGTA